MSSPDQLKFIETVVRIMFKSRFGRAAARQQQGQKLAAAKQDYIEDKAYRVYLCLVCRAHLASHDELISKLFQGNHGRAYLFNKVVNVGCKPAVERELLTGLHAVADIFCTNCGTLLGWKYTKAFVDSQKYKEGKFILELHQLIKQSSWDLTSYNVNKLLLDHEQAQGDIETGGYGQNLFSDADWRRRRSMPKDEHPRSLGKNSVCPDWQPSRAGLRHASIETTSLGATSPTSPLKRNDDSGDTQSAQLTRAAIDIIRPKTNAANAEDGLELIERSLERQIRLQEADMVTPGPGRDLLSLTANRIPQQHVNSLTSAGSSPSSTITAAVSGTDRSSPSSTALSSSLTSSEVSNLSDETTSATH